VQSPFQQDHFDPFEQHKPINRLIKPPSQHGLRSILIRRQHNR
jgi:hypothetical protein